jgi:hypothetical protein
MQSAAVCARFIVVAETPVHLHFWESRLPSSPYIKEITCTYDKEATIVYVQ